MMLHFYSETEFKQGKISTPSANIMRPSVQLPNVSSVERSNNGYRPSFQSAPEPPALDPPPNFDFSTFFVFQL